MLQVKFLQLYQSIVKSRLFAAQTSKKFQSGLTMIELLVVISIVAFLLVMVAFVSQTQMTKGRDSRRKSDMDRLKVAFEDYYNDNNCYPAATVLDDCNSDALQPYLDRVPCDPRTQESYSYQPLPNACRGYRLLTELENPLDTVSVELGCATSCGCGAGGDYNYGVSSGVTVVGDTSSCTPLTSSSPVPSGSGGPGASSSPQPSPSPTFVYACDPSGICNEYEEGIPFLDTCPVTYQLESACESECSPVSPNRCGG
jgi:prepilin-type N-terminal cleavage/methylation domain-containing protein